jgi:hypothetical protein
VTKGEGARKETIYFEGGILGPIEATAGAFEGSPKNADGLTLDIRCTGIDFVYINAAGVEHTVAIDEQSHVSNDTLHYKSLITALST